MSLRICIARWAVKRRKNNQQENCLNSWNHCVQQLQAHFDRDDFLLSYVARPFGWIRSPCLQKNFHSAISEFIPMLVHSIRLDIEYKFSFYRSFKIPGHL